jgi:hypothetical protein
MAGARCPSCWHLLLLLSTPPLLALTGGGQQTQQQQSSSSSAAAAAVAAQAEAATPPGTQDSAVKYIPNVTCLSTTTLRPRQMFPEFPFGGARTGAECCVLCARVDGAGAALWYAQNAFVNHSTDFSRSTVPHTGRFIPSTPLAAAGKTKGFCECRVALCALAPYRRAHEVGQHNVGDGGGIYILDWPSVSEELDQVAHHGGEHAAASSGSGTSARASGSDSSNGGGVPGGAGGHEDEL